MIIDYITYINLDYRIDKFYHINKQLHVCNIPYFKTQGVVCENYLYYPIEDNDITNNPSRYKGTIGCFLSHIQAINNLLDRSEDLSDNYIMVLEDDVVIDSNFWNYLLNLETDSKFDFIFFNSGKELDRSKCLNLDYQLYQVYDDYPIFCGAFCYAIHTSKLKTVKEKLTNINIYKDFDRFIYTHKELYNACYQTDLIMVDSKFSSDRDPTHSWRNKVV